MTKNLQELLLLSFSSAMLLMLLVNCRRAQNELKCDEKIQLTIEVKSKIDVETIYLAGNTSQLGEWKPDGLAIDMTGNIGQTQLCIEKHKTIEFKITAGSWAREAIYSEGRPPQNFVIKPTKDTILKIVVENWKNKMAMNNDGMTGDFIQYNNVQYPGLLERDVIVWLPPDYQEENDTKYPVLYMHDGQNVFNPYTSTVGVDWGADEWADSLIRYEHIEPIIVVAINCTDDRYLDYSPGKNGQRYMEFIKDNLKPAIDSIYRTKSDNSNTAVMGASMGGLISFMMHWEHNDVFGKAASLSPAYVFKGINYPNTVSTYEGDRKNLNLYISNGTEGLEEVLQTGCDEMMKVLDELNYSYTWNLHEGAEHNEIAWNQLTGEVMLKMFGK